MLAENLMMFFAVVAGAGFSVVAVFAALFWLRQRNLQNSLVEKNNINAQLEQRIPPAHLSA